MRKSRSHKDILFVLLLILLGGCATLSKEKCLEGDWFGLGVKDGQAGKSASQLERHIEACAEYGIAINREQYMKGRDQGLREYCQPENAFATGLRGKAYTSECPIEIHFIFLRYNQAALEVHQRQSDLERVDREISKLEDHLDDKDLSDEDRHNTRKSIRALDEDRYRLRDELRSAEEYLDQLMDESRHRPATAF